MTSRYVPFSSIIKTTKQRRTAYFYVSGYAGTGALGLPSRVIFQKSDSGEMLLSRPHVKTPRIVSLSKLTNFSSHRPLIACGVGFTLVHQKRNLFFFGLNILDPEKGEKLIVKPREIRVGSERFSLLSAGRSHFMALSDDGRVMSAGANKFGQCGTDRTNDWLNGIGRAHAVSCGLDHSLVLTDEGRLISFGRNDQNQLGRLSDFGDLRPVKGAIESKKIVKIATKGDFSLAIDTNGVLYGWGNNEFGQCVPSADSFRPQIAEPAPVGIPHRVLDVATTAKCSIAIVQNDQTGKRELWSWGFWKWADKDDCRNFSASCGFKKINFDLSDDGQLTSGLESFGFVDSRTGIAHLWGDNRHFNLPVDLTQNEIMAKSKKSGGFISEPRRMSVAMRVSDLGLGLDHSIAFVQSFA